MLDDQTPTLCSSVFQSRSFAENQYLSSRVFSKSRMGNTGEFCSVVGDLLSSLNWTAKDCLSSSYGQTALSPDSTWTWTAHCHICIQTIFVDASVESLVYKELSVPCDSLLIVVTHSASVCHEKNAHGDGASPTYQLINTIPIVRHTVFITFLLNERNNIKWGGESKTITTFQQHLWISQTSLSI